jgi:hypothetical protein
MKAFIQGIHLAHAKCVVGVTGVQSLFGRGLIPLPLAGVFLGKYYTSEFDAKHTTSSFSVYKACTCI